MTTDVDKVWGDLDIPADERADLLGGGGGVLDEQAEWEKLSAADRARALGLDIGAPEAEEPEFDLFKGVSDDQEHWERLSPQARQALLE